MSSRYQQGGDLLVAQDAVHAVSDFFYTLVSRNIGSPFTDRCSSTRYSVLELAAQVLLTARIKRHLPYDSFIAEFRDQNQTLLNKPEISDVIKLLMFAESDVPNADKDQTLLRPNTVRSYLDGGGKIHKGGINPHARGRGSRTSDPPSHKALVAAPEQHHSTRSSVSNAAQHRRVSSGLTNVNRVWVLEPLDDLAAATTGNPYCVGATLFRNGEQILTVVAVSNIALSEKYKRQIPLKQPYGEMFSAVKGHGTFVLPLGLKQRGQRVPVRLDPRDPALQDLKGHKAFPRINVVIPEGQELEARGCLTPKELIPPQQLPPPTSPRASRLRGTSLTLADLQQDLYVAKSDMIGTGPTLKTLLEAHANTAYHLRSSLLRYILVATGQVHASMAIPYSAGPHADTSIWKEAGGSLLVEEAGGIVTDAEGQDLDFTNGRMLRRNFGILATRPGMIHWRLIDAIKGDLGVTGADSADHGLSTGRWTKEWNFGPWSSAKGKEHEIAQDVGHPAVWPRYEDGQPKELRSHTFRLFDQWPRARQTWQPGTATGAWVKENGTVTRQVQPGQTAGARFLPGQAKTVPHEGLCMWPCPYCEPEANREWYAGYSKGTI